MKPTAQRKAKREAGKKRDAKRKKNKNVKIKKHATHEERKKEKAKKATKRRKDFEKRLTIRNNNLSTEARKEPMKTPESRKHQLSAKEVQKRGRQAISQAAAEQSSLN